MADPDLSARAAASIGREARWLDLGAYERWQEWFADDAVLWVPLDPTSHPGRDQSLYLDDRRRLGERVGWLATPSAWGQHPPSTCVRVVGGVEAWSERGAVIVRSTFTLVEQRQGRHQMLAGHQIHELVGSPTRCRTKIILVPRLTVGVRNPSFLL
ncbi:MAG: aromatic-ring-hydroxylating dioxygenase subunit beta [Desertimonas sp.]